jgi:hypothetical protein
MGLGFFFGTVDVSGDSVSMREIALRRALLSAALLLMGRSLVGQTSVLTQHNDVYRTGANLTETVLTPADVNVAHFGMLFKHVVDDQLYTQPLVVVNVSIGGGTHDVVYVTTVNNSVYAFDARDAGNAQPFWHVNFGTPASLHSANFGCLDINGKMGIIGTPVIDAEKGVLYVVAVTEAKGKFAQRLHALDLTTGADLPDSPRTIEAPGFDPLLQSQRPALLLHAGYVYVGYASHCDKGPYHGYMMAYAEVTLKQVAVFNTSPGGNGASVWQSGQAPAVDEDGNIHLVTGNGDWDGKAKWSESFLKFDKLLNLLDWFTPTNHEELDAKDEDLDSAGATLIPGTHLVVGGGKEGVLYSLDTRHLGNLGDEHAVQHFKATGSHLHSLVFWESAKSGRLLYIWGQRDKERVYRFHGDKLEETPWMTRPDANEGHPGAMLSLSAHGKRDGILWASIHHTGDSWHESRPGILHAYDADDIEHELWNSLENPGRDDCGNFSKMAPPTVANGMVYLASFGAQNIGTGQLCVYGLLPSGGGPAAPVGLQGKVADHFVTLTWGAVSGASTYTVEREGQMVGSGVTTPAFRDPAAEKGTMNYTVTAVNRSGVRGGTAKVSVEVVKVPVERMQH